MRGIGTIVNGLAVIIGGVLGLWVKKGIPDSMKKGLFQIIGIMTIFIGLLGLVKESLIIENNKVVLSGQMLLLVSMIIGFFLGEWTDVEGKIVKLGEGLKAKIPGSQEGFVQGFVSATILICVGAMAIVGSLEDGLRGDPSILYAKSLLDMIALMIFTSTLGAGAIFSVIPMVLYQGSITLLSNFLAPHLSPDLIGHISLVGNGLIFCIGINLLFDKNIKVANLLWALVIPILYHFLF